MDAADRRNRASAEAAHWLVRLQSGDMERSEREQFVDWLRESHIHIAEMLRIAQVHGTLEQFDRWAFVSTEGSKSKKNNVVQLPPLTTSGDEDSSSARENTEAESRVQHAWRKGHPRSPVRVRFSVAAAAVAVLFVAGAVLLPQIRGRVIETERGERREVVLNDGSLVQVDPETRLRVKYADAVRRVFLEHGRALFHVAKNANRPFMVQADGTTVRAVGTAFGVERQPQGIVVTVAEGRVAVLPATAALGSVLASKPENPTSRALSSDAETGARTAFPLSKLREKRGLAHPEGELPATANTKSEYSQEGHGSVYLTANQQVTVQRSGTADPVRQVDSQRELAWAEGRLIFHNDDVSKVISEFNRYNRVQLTVTDAALASRSISGVFNASEPEAFIAFLQTVAPVEIARDDDKSIMIGSPRHR